MIVQITAYFKVDERIPAIESKSMFLLTNSVQVARQYQNPLGWDEDPEAPTDGTTKVRVLSPRVRWQNSSLGLGLRSRQPLSCICSFPQWNHYWPM